MRISFSAKCILIICFSLGAQSLSYGQEQFSEPLDKLFEMAVKENKSLKNASLQKELSALSKNIAKKAILNPQVPVNFQAVDNLKLQSVFVPGPIFGQPEGTFQKFTMGQKYVSTFSIQPQFDLFNLGARVQSNVANLNDELENLNVRKAQRDHFLQINSAYHNILSFQGQKKYLLEALEKSKKIFEIVSNRYQEGIVSSQDVNEAKVNLLNIENNLFQIEENLKVQEEILRVLAYENYQITEEPPLENIKVNNLVDNSFLDNSIADFKYKKASEEFRGTKSDIWPIISLFGGFNWQNLSNSFFYGANSNTINFASIGLKVNWELPINTQKWANQKNKEYQMKMALNDWQVQQESSRLEAIKRQSEYIKSKSQWETMTKIAALKYDTFDKQFALFEEQVLSLDKLLIAQNDWLLSQMDVISNAANTSYNFHQIRIFNKN